MILTSLFASLVSLGTGWGSAPVGDETLGLRSAWTQPLGSAYSRVAARGDAVVTQYSDGEQDFVVALEASDGSVRWRHALGPVYLGHDGSEDGPVSTPVIGAEATYALGPRGKLVALDLARGETLWSVHLVHDLDAVEPEYGFTSSPLLEEGLLIVQTGGSQSRNLCAFDARSGELRWSLGDGAALYQSPVVLELAGRRQLVVLNGQELLGVAPDSGELLWTHRLGERDSASSGSAGAIDDARFFLFVSGQLAVFGIERDADSFQVAELYRTRELGGTYAKPVHHEGYLYGFKSAFLTCVDASNGKRVWKSRPPGGRGLVLVGDRLVVFGAMGRVVVVPASPDGFREESSISALASSGYTWPTSSGRNVFVRNDEELACLEWGVPGEASSGLTRSSGAEPVEGAFGAFLAGLDGADDPRARVAEYLGGVTSFPLVEGDRVHFLYAGEAEDVAVVGSMTGAGGADPMSRVPGTDLFHRSYSIEPGARWEYTFQVDFGDRTLDPRNPREVAGSWPERVSEVVTPGYRAPTHLGEPAGARGRLETLEFTSEQLGNTRRLDLYLPAGYDDGEQFYPLLLVHDGPDWIEKGRLVNALDNLIGSSVAPVVVAFVEPIPEAWFESGGSRTEPYLGMLAEELVPHLAESYRLSHAAQDRALMGLGGFGLTAAFGVVAYPEVFGKAAVQSVALEDVAMHAFFARLAASPPRGAHFYVDWNRYEPVDPDRRRDRGAEGRRLFEALESAGCRVTGGMSLDAAGWTAWSARTDDWLETLFPLR